MATRSAEGRQNLLAAARRLIAEKGLEGLKVRPLAQEAGVSPGLVIYHFPDRDSMRFEVHESLVAEYLRSRLRVVDAQRDPRHQLVASVIAGVPPFVDLSLIRPLFEMHGLARRSEPHARLMTGLWNDEVALYERIIGTGVAEGHFQPARPVPEVAQSLLALEDGLALHQVSNNTALTAETAVSAFVRAAAAQLGCESLPEVTDEVHIQVSAELSAP